MRLCPSLTFNEKQKDKSLSADTSLQSGTLPHQSSRNNFSCSPPRYHLPTLWVFQLLLVQITEWPAPYSLWEESKAAGQNEWLQPICQLLLGDFFFIVKLFVSSVAGGLLAEPPLACKVGTLTTVPNTAQPDREDCKRDTSKQLCQPLPLCHSPPNSHFKALNTAAHETARACPAARSALPSASSGCFSSLFSMRRTYAMAPTQKHEERFQRIDLKVEMFSLQGKPLQSQCQARTGEGGVQPEHLKTLCCLQLHSPFQNGSPFWAGLSDPSPASSSSCCSLHRQCLPALTACPGLPSARSCLGSSLLPVVSSQ